MPTDYTLSPAEAAKVLGVHVDTVTRWAKDGKLPCFTTPGGWRRFRRADLEALLPSDSQPAGTAA